MEPEIIDTIIIGAGLSGMYAAALLQAKGESFLVLEARDRIGGRIASPDYNGYAADLGPSWYWPEVNQRVNRLMKELGLSGYPQYDAGYGRFQAEGGAVRTIPPYPMEPESWRINGGMISLVYGLYERIPEDAVRLNHPVCEIERDRDNVTVSVGTVGETPLCRFRSARVILAIPPRLAAATILFTPDLSFDLAQAMLKTSTWMAGQAKIFVLYECADWRQSGLSGQAFSQCGPLVEIHDASNGMGTPFGLTGFVGIPAAQRCNREVLIREILGQLQIVYGHRAAEPAAVFYKDWAKEGYTATEYDRRAANDHPLYQAPLGKPHIWDGTVLFAGTETSDQYGGYLEGALASAERAVHAFAGL